MIGVQRNQVEPKYIKIVRWCSNTYVEVIILMLLWLLVSGCVAAALFCHLCGRCHRQVTFSLEFITSPVNEKIILHQVLLSHLPLPLALSQFTGVETLLRGVLGLHHIVSMMHCIHMHKMHV